MPTHGPGSNDPSSAGGSVSEAELLDAVRAWLPGRRWFPAKGGEAQLEAVGGLTLADPRGQAEVRLLLVRARTSTVDVVLQVPLTLHTDRSAAPESADWVATVSGGTVHVRDGGGDPAFLRAWLAAAEGPGTAPTELGLDVDHPRVISGEQSNTSVILPGGDGGAILKIFRTLTPGENPDVDVPRRLAAAGWTHVPRPLGWLDGCWTTADGETGGSLGVLSEFVEGASDGFEMACDMASRHESFGRLAEDLGRVVAGMHVALAEALPVPDDDAPAGSDEPGVILVADTAGGAEAGATDGAGAADEPGATDESGATAGGDAGATGTGSSAVHTARAQELVAALEERYRWAVGSVPELDRWSAAVAERLERVRGRDDLPPRQRVHGDLHLGQALRARDQWYVLDFEGEPLSGLEARTRPDLALRDVAGMLRSFDYAAALREAPPQWAQEARTEFLRGYAAETGAEPDADLVDLLELDKALYEAVYEARNRPQWRHIPAAALERLLADQPD